MKRFYFAILFVLVIMNVLMCYKVWILKDTIGNKIITEEPIELKSIITAIVANSCISVNAFQKIEMENDTTSLLLNSLIDQPKLFFYFNEMSCNPCTDKELQKLDSLSSIIGSENVFLLTKHSSVKSLYLFRRANQFSFRIVFIEEIDYIPISNFPLNFYFVLDKDYYTKMFFVPSKTYSDVNDVYYSKIVKYFQSEYGTGNIYRSEKNE